MLAAPLFGQGPPAGYTDYEKFRFRVRELGRSDLVTVKSLATTLGGREIYLLKLGHGEIDKKPAMLIVGGVESDRLAGGEICIAMAMRWSRQHKKDAALTKLFDRYTIYIIPRPSPDATERCFGKPYGLSATNQRPTDDDRDGVTDEDPPEDLNGDGWITKMRVEDPAGLYMPHPQDARVMIKADPKKGERGRYRLLSEGKDNDGDEAWNEDGPGGVRFNKNFTFAYPFFKVGAGPHQVSEIETRAIADFAFSRPNIAMVVSFTPEDNLMHPWKPNAGAESKRIKTTLFTDDAAYVKRIAEKYRKIHGEKNAPTSPKGAGSFSEWAYFHYGRWSFASRPWWIPKPKDAVAKTGDAKKTDGKDKKENDKDKADKKADDKRGTDQLNTLRWLKREKIDGFVEWTEVKHADFPGRKVEVGGFKTLLTQNPPHKQISVLAEKQAKFAVELLGQMPRVSIGETKVESVGEGVFRLQVTVVNTGYLPTLSKMGAISQLTFPLILSLELPKGAKLVTGHLRTHLGPLAGTNGRSKHTWLILAKDAKARTVRASVASPSVGKSEKTVKLP